MDLGASPSAGTELRALGAELGALRAGQAAELGQLEQALAQARAERAAAAAAARQEAAEVARLRVEVAQLRAQLRCRRELGARSQLEAITGDLWPKRGTSGEVARLQELGGPWVQQEALGEELRALGRCHPRPHGPRCHRCPWVLGDTVSPPAEDPEDAQCLEGTRSQETTGSLKPFILFLVASTIIFLYPYLKQSWDGTLTPPWSTLTPPWRILTPPWSTLTPPQEP